MTKWVLKERSGLVIVIVHSNCLNCTTIHKSYLFMKDNFVLTSPSDIISINRIALIRKIWISVTSHDI